jgi:hypothetical protein
MTRGIFSIANRVSYYPCDICGDDIPGNVVYRDKNGKTVAYCPRHDAIEKDKRKGLQRVKNKNQFLDNFRKAFVNVDTNMNTHGV